MPHKGELYIFTAIRTIITFQGGAKSTVIFDNNKATQNGGAIHLQKTSSVTLKGTILLKFHNNEATLGGAISCKGHICFPKYC